MGAAKVYTQQIKRKGLRILLDMLDVELADVELVCMRFTNKKNKNNLGSFPLSKLSDHLCLRHQRPESHAQMHHFGGKVKIADFHDTRYC
jgi:hypothetical protein